MSAYMSGDDSEDETTTNENKKADITKTIESSCHISDDDTPPVEVKNIRFKEGTCKQNQVCNVAENKLIGENNQIYKKKKRRRERQISKKDNSGRDFVYEFKKRRVTLLEKLLDREIRHERNVLLQCVRFVVINNFFDKVVV